MTAGWYALVGAGDDWKPVSEAEGRRSIAEADARDLGATHVGYWNGVEWEDITPALP